MSFEYILNRLKMENKKSKLLNKNVDDYSQIRSLTRYDACVSLLKNQANSTNRSNLTTNETIRSSGLTEINNTGDDDKNVVKKKKKKPRRKKRKGLHLVQPTVKIQPIQLSGNNENGDVEAPKKKKKKRRRKRGKVIPSEEQSNMNLCNDKIRQENKSIDNIGVGKKIRKTKSQENKAKVDDEIHHFSDVNDEAIRKKTQELHQSKHAKVEGGTFDVKVNKTNNQITKKKKRKTNRKKFMKNIFSTKQNVNRNNGNITSNTQNLPSPLLTLKAYYESYGMEIKDGYVVQTGTEPTTFAELYKLAKQEGAKMIVDNEECISILPEIFYDLLTLARNNKDKTITDKLLRRNSNLIKLWLNIRKQLKTIDDAMEKFDIFNYLLLVDEILQCDYPVAGNVNLEITEGKRKKGNKIKNQLKLKNKDDTSDLFAVVNVTYNNSESQEVRPMMKLYALTDDLTNEMYGEKLELTVVDVTMNEKNDTKISFIVAGSDDIKKLNLLRKSTVSLYSLPHIQSTLGFQQASRFIRDLNLSEKLFPTERQNMKNISDYKMRMSKEMNDLFTNCDIKYNDSQKEAIYGITRKTSSTFILFGPPGTGKTTTLVESIRQLCKKYPSNKFLICTPSNMAADAISLQLLKKNFIDSNKIFRLVSSTQDAFTRNHQLDPIVEMDDLKSPDQHVIRKYYKLPENAELERKRIIICTLGSTIRLYKTGLSRGYFSHIFIDEAAQCTEMESWLPIGLFATENTRIILSGDPKQLGPVTTIDCFYPKSTSFKISLLSRLYQYRCFVNNPERMIQLKENHRSHEEIVNIFSNLFYGGTLIPTAPKGFDSLCKIEILPCKNFPILFHSITTGKEEISKTKSRKNMVEVEMVMKYIRALRNNYKVADNDIGIIAPYAYHSNEIKTRLERNSKITVGSVEKFQGSEKRVIIFTTVRSGNNIGFMADETRFNTAISRAKHLLIVIGNEATFSNTNPWKTFIKICKQKQSFATGNKINKIPFNIKDLTCKIGNLQI